MIIASNFKTNHTRKSTAKFVKTVSTLMTSANITDEVMIFPPSSCFDEFDLAQNLFIGAQNAYPCESGSFTGEIGLCQLDEFGIKTVLIGHSERRHVLKESHDLLVQKYNFFKERGFRIVFCIGEPLEVRERGVDAVMQYNLAQLEDIDIEYDNLIIAYEPVWAIGTGVSASIEQIEQTHKRLRSALKAPILYGGSVKVENLKDILAVDNVDGVLVGTASWKEEDFSKMIMISKEMK